MYSLYGKQVNGIVLVGGKLGVTQPPMFYCGLYPVPLFQINNDEELVQVQSQLIHEPVQPNYAVFFGMDDIDKRVQHIESSLNLKFTLERRIEASFLDDVFYRLNPKNNKNETAFIYKINLQ